MWLHGSQIGASRTHVAWFALAAAMLLLGQDAVAAPGQIDRARALLLGGKYAESAEIFAASLDATSLDANLEEAQAASAPTATAALGLARCMAARGKNAAARRVLKDSLEKLKYADHEKASIHAELAMLALRHGDHAAADEHAKTALGLDPDQLLARLLRAELLRLAGKIDEAHRAYAWLVKYHNNEQNDTFGHVESLRWIGLAAARLAEWNHNAADFKFLVNDLYPAAIKVDSNYWPAHYERGRLFLQKHNRADAARAFSAALAINPRAAEVHAAEARLALLNRDVKTASAKAHMALEINPRLLAAWHVKADLLWANFDVRGARKLLAEKILPLNTRNEQTLGRLAACHIMLAKKSDLAANSAGISAGISTGENKPLAQIIKDVETRNPRAADFYFQLGSWLDDRHKFPAARRYYLEAQKLIPRKTGPAAALGMLDMRAGRESEAKRLLTAAAKADPFNVRTANTLELFEVIDSLHTDACDEYVLRYDAQSDELLGRYAKAYLAEIYPSLCKQFGYRAPQPPLVEIFNAARGQNGHQWFGVRMTGLPYVGTVAACSGRVVAMTSPGDPSIAKKFNWARVLKHELIHVVTLQQTDFNIPHWFTEGLAVRGEDHPRPHDWNVLLCRRHKRGKLYTLDTINFGFTRPGSGADWTMAYCQAELYVDYIIAQHGQDAIAGLLQAYAANRSTGQAIEDVLSVSQEQFEAGFLNYVKDIAKQVSGLPGSEPLPPLEELQKRHRATQSGDKPPNVDLTAQLALAYLRRGMKTEAIEMAAEVNATDPKHPLGAYVLARLALGVSRTAAAEHLLQNALNSEQPHPLVLELLAKLKIEAKLYEPAAKLYRLGHRHEPHNPHWLRRLARVYLLTKNEPKLTESLSLLAQIDVDDDTIRTKLAMLAIEQQDYATATRWAREAIYIDVLNPAAHKAFAEALAGRHNYQMAIDEFETAIKLDPADLSLRFELVDTCLKTENITKARKVLDELLKVDPDDPAAIQLRESLDEETVREEEEEQQ